MIKVKIYTMLTPLRVALQILEDSFVGLRSIFMADVIKVILSHFM